MEARYPRPSSSRAQPPDELPVLLRHPALRRRHLEALVGLLVAVPLRESPRAKLLAHRSQKWISSGCVLEVLQCCLNSPKSLKLHFQADTALDRLDCPTREVGLRSLEEQPMHRLEYPGDIAEHCYFLSPLLQSAIHQHSPRPKAAVRP